MTTLLLSAGLLLGLAVGLPIALALLVSGGLAIAWGGFGVPAIATSLVTAVSGFPLLAVPMFVLTGVVFDRAGIADRLVQLARALFGTGPGLLPLIGVVVGVVLGGISGSGPAAAAAIGGVLAARMLAAGFPRGFTATTIGASASIDILIPPSIALIIYAVLVPTVSVPAIFAAGVVPGLLVAAVLCGANLWILRRAGWRLATGADGQDESRPPLGRTLLDATWGLAAPVVILGGLRLGIFTPTEAGAVAALFGLAVGVFVYRTMGWRDVLDCLAEAAEAAGTILLVIACAAVYAWAINTSGAAPAAAAWIAGLGLGPEGLLVATFIVVLLAGMLLDGVSVFLIGLPVLLPIAVAAGADLTWFGIFLTVGVAIGQFTPPVAVNLAVTCRIAGAPIEATFRWIWPFLVGMVLVALALVVLPDLALWLPRVLGYAT